MKPNPALLFHVDCIGYCSKIQDQPPPPERVKKDSVYLDTQMFKIPEDIQPEVKPKQQSALTTEIVKVRLAKNNFFAFVPENTLKKSIRLHVKTLYGQRKSITIEAALTCTFDQLKKIIFEKLEQDPSLFYNTRLIFPSWTLFELGTGFKTIGQEMVPQDSRLVLLTQRIFSFCVPKQLGSLKMGNNNFTVTKTGDNLYNSLLGTLAFEDTGRYYWEVRLDNFVDEEDIFLGIATSDIDLNACPTCAGSYWGYMPLLSKKFSAEVPNDLLDYGFTHKLGDIVGVLLQFSKGEATLSFYKNGIYCGVAFKGIQGKLYPVVTLFGNVGTISQVTLDPKALSPSCDTNRRY